MHWNLWAQGPVESSDPTWDHSDDEVFSDQSGWSVWKIVDIIMVGSEGLFQKSYYFGFLRAKEF